MARERKVSACVFCVRAAREVVEKSVATDVPYMQVTAPQRMLTSFPSFVE